MKLTKNQQLVMTAYEADPNCVNEENLLLEAVWISQGWDNTKSLYWNLSRVSHPESLSRARRKLHELGLITYSKDAENARYSAYKKDTNRYSGHEQVKANIVSPQFKLVSVVNGEEIVTLKETR